MLLEEQILRENELSLGYFEPIAFYLLKESGFQKIVGIGHWTNIKQIQAYFVSSDYSLFVNFSFGNSQLREQVQDTMTSKQDNSVFDLGTVITLLLFCFITSGAWYRIKQVNESYVLKTLGKTDKKL